MVIRSTRSVFSVLAFAALGLIACTSTTETPAGSKDDDRDDGASSSSSSSSSSGGSSSSSSSSGGADPATCGAKTSYSACMDCCTGSKPEVFEKADKAFYECLCTTPGTCKAECATDLCAADPNSIQETQACKDCIEQKGEPCIEAAGDACDEACQAASECEEQAKCAEKE